MKLFFYVDNGYQVRHIMIYTYRYILNGRSQTKEHHIAMNIHDSV